MMSFEITGQKIYFFPKVRNPGCLESHKIYNQGIAGPWGQIPTSSTLLRWCWLEAGWLTWVLGLNLQI